MKMVEGLGGMRSRDKKRGIGVVLRFNSLFLPIPPVTS
jgi:hypothetical protein